MERSLTHKAISRPHLVILRPKMTKYTHISVPFSLAEELKKFVGFYGLRNVSEVACHCIRASLVLMKKVNEIE